MKRVLLAVLGVAVSCLSGCGGSSDNTTASSSPTTTPGMNATATAMPGSPPPATASYPMQPSNVTPMMPPGATGSTTPYPMQPSNTTPMMPPGAAGSSTPYPMQPSNVTPMMPPGATGSTTPYPMQPSNTTPMMPPGAAGSTTPYPMQPSYTTPMMPPVAVATAPMMPPVAVATAPMMPPVAVATAPMTPGYNPMYPGAPGSEAAKPKTLSELADDAFRKGQDREAFQLLCAASLVNEEAAERLPDDFRWVPYLRKPALAVRWGLGVIYTPSKGYTGHPSPIGYVAAETTNASGPMGTPMGTSTPSGQPKRKSRILGQRNRDQGNYGSSPTTSGQPNTNQPPVVSQPPADPADFLAYYTGEVGEKVLEALEKRATDGVYGDALRRGIEAHESPAPAGTNAPGAVYMPMGVPMALPMNQGGDTKSEPFKTAAILPGIVMLGRGSEKELLDEAEQQQVDFVVLFEVTVRKSNKDATNNTKFKVMSLEKAKLAASAADTEGASAREIFASGTINSSRVESAREKSETDPLETELSEFTAALDAAVTTTPILEKVSTDAVAQKRANFLATQGSANPLASLAEIRCYQQAKLLNDKEAAECMAKLLGGADKVKKLLTGKTETERAAVLSKWLPKT